VSSASFRNIIAFVVGATNNTDEQSAALPWQVFFDGKRSVPKVVWNCLDAFFFLWQEGNADAID